MDKLREWYILVVELLILFIKIRSAVNMTLKSAVEGLNCARDLTLFNPDSGEVRSKEQLNTMNRDFVDTCESAIKFLSDNNFVYDRLFSILKYQWAITCEHDEKLTDKIERCETALTTLKNLGFNLVTGEVENV